MQVFLIVFSILYVSHMGAVPYIRAASTISFFTIPIFCPGNIRLFVSGAVSFFGIKLLYTDYKYDKIYT